MVVNLYPFEPTVAGGADFATCIENIDIGGPAMIRAAAKNHDGVTVVVDPADYAPVLAEMDAQWRRDDARRCGNRWRPRPSPAPRPTTRRSRRGSPAGSARRRRRRATIAGRLAETLRYGENPHQCAAFYRSGEQRFGVATAAQVQGKELSYNNLNDTDAAYELVAEFDPKASAAVAIIKHANPCGVAIGSIARGGLRQGAAPAIPSAPSAASSR